MKGFSSAGTPFRDRFGEGTYPDQVRIMPSSLASYYMLAYTSVLFPAPCSLVGNFHDCNSELMHCEFCYAYHAPLCSTL